MIKCFHVSKFQIEYPLQSGQFWKFLSDKVFFFCTSVYMTKATLCFTFYQRTYLGKSSFIIIIFFLHKVCLLLGTVCCLASLSVFNAIFFLRFNFKTLLRTYYHDFLWTNFYRYKWNKSLIFVLISFFKQKRK